MRAAPTRAQVERRLRLVRWLALLDLALLVALLAASWSGQREWVRLLGPLHGGNYLLLLVVVGTAAADGYWSWWFPAAVLVTGGPPGALVGEWLVARRLRAAPPAMGSTGIGPAGPGEREVG